MPITGTAPAIHVPAAGGTFDGARISLSTSYVWGTGIYIPYDTLDYASDPGYGSHLASDNALTVLKNGIYAVVSNAYTTVTPQQVGEHLQTQLQRYTGSWTLLLTTDLFVPSSINGPAAPSGNLLLAWHGPLFANDLLLTEANIWSNFATESLVAPTWMSIEYLGPSPT